jgi:uncharacterized phiE125 gp8 family phage protein
VIYYNQISAVEQADPTEPVTLAEVKEWANVDHADDDSLLTSMIIGARQDIEGETNLRLVPNDVRVTFTTDKASLISLPYGPPTSLLIYEVDSDGVETALDEDYYAVDGNSIAFTYTGKMSLTYVVGDPATVPQALKEAIKMLVAYRYNNRGDQEKQQGLPEDIKWKVKRYQQVWL